MLEVEVKDCFLNDDEDGEESTIGTVDVVFGAVDVNKEDDDTPPLRL